jgi:hypothetical protein
MIGPFEVVWSPATEDWLRLSFADAQAVAIAVRAAFRGYEGSSYPGRPKCGVPGHTRYRLTRNARVTRVHRVSTYPQCPRSIGHTGYRLTRNARVTRVHRVSTYPQCPSHSGAQGIDLPTMPEVDRACWVSTYPQCPSHSGAQGIDLPAMPALIGHTGHRLTRNARSGSYMRGADFPRPPDAVETIGHGDRTYWVCRCLVRPARSGVGGTSFARRCSATEQAPSGGLC